MTSKPVDTQHTRGWRELKSMLLGSRGGHGCCGIDDHRMIILGGYNNGNVLSSGFIYDVRTKKSTPLLNDMPAARYGLCAVANERFMYVIGGKDADRTEVDTMYRLSLETYEWTTMAPMGTARDQCAGVLLGDYVYIFGGKLVNDTYEDELVSVERYSIVGNNWADLPEMAVAREGHCAVATALSNRIYILGDVNCDLEVFDAASLDWRAEASLCDIPKDRIGAAAVVLKNRYLVMIGGYDWEEGEDSAGCLIYDCSINRWSSIPASMNMIRDRGYHTAAVLDGKIVVAGGNDHGHGLSSMECIDAQDILQYAPLDYPLPQPYFDQILQLGKVLLVTKYT